MNELLALVLDPRLVLVAAAVFVGGFIREFVGFGAALVSVPVMSLIFGPRMAVAVSSVMAIPAILQLLPEAVRHSERPVVLPIAAAIFMATPVGSTLLMVVDPAVMRIVISGLVVLMVAVLASAPVSALGSVSLRAAVGTGCARRAQSSCGHEYLRANAEAHCGSLS